ncbi:ester cyclase [Miltoncostaea marina]|uniref:ester cyclase n=1 Tax=Miltoncostaea marina TaxID=2843215 RepID=UPI001C3CFA67|nr:nuclear transport factor 2 family protein [Miltoncostaea marina]
MTLSGVVARYADAWDARDPVACAGCFAPDAVRTWCVRPPGDSGRGALPRFVGREAIAEGIAGFMAAAPDMRLVIDALSEGSDDRIWVEWRITGTRQRPWRGIPGNGEPFELVGVSIFRVARGLLAEERAYWDPALMASAPPEPALA